MKHGNHTQKLFFLMVMVVFLALGSLANATPPALQTQYGPDGIEVDLIRCKVTDNVLSVAFLVRSTAEKGVDVDFHIEAVHYVANNKKYQVLKDDKGNWLSGPQNLQSGGTHVYLSSSKKSKIVWYKFPAPPQDVTKIQLNVDEIMPFDDVEVQR